MGFSADYELLRAARWRGYTWEQFDPLDSDSQALIVAEYRIEMRFAAVDHYAQSLKAHHGSGTGRNRSRRAGR
jgi:hypothetical protein